MTAQQGGEMCPACRGAGRVGAGAGGGPPPGRGGGGGGGGGGAPPPPPAISQSQRKARPAVDVVHAGPQEGNMPTPANQDTRSAPSRSIPRVDGSPAPHAR